MSSSKHIVVIGGGIAGYPAAIKAARLGARVTLIEKSHLGGTCLNWGCIPTKSLLQAMRVRRMVEEAAIFGIQAVVPKVDFTAIMGRKDMVVAGLRKGVAGLLKAKKIEVISGKAQMLDSKTVVVGKEKLSANAVIIATGSAPAVPPIAGLDKVDYWDSNGFLSMQSLPPSAVIIGGGVIGLEFAQVLRGLGSKVTVLEMMDQIAPGLDREIAEALEQVMAAQGVEIVTGAKVAKVAKTGKQTAVHYIAKGEERQAKASKLIVAVGRRPSLGGLDAAKLGLALQEGAVRVDYTMATSLPGVFAAGDVTGGMLLAHLAMAEGECAALGALGQGEGLDTRAVPACIYTTPEVASVGLSEEQAAERGPIRVGRFPFKGVGKAVVINESQGMVKIVAGAKHNELLGVHILGPHATDLIAEAVLALKLECTAEELAGTIHPHPTLSEAVMEAGLSLCGGAVHMP